MKLSALDPNLATRPKLESGVAIRARALAEVHLEALSPGDIAFCLRQSIALKHIVPLALAILAEQPLLEAELYPGDLLSSLLHATLSHPLTVAEADKLRDICADARASVTTFQSDVLPEIAAFLDRRAGT